MKTLLYTLLLALAGFPAIAQKSKDVIHSKDPITWLGLDFTLARFIGDANQWKDAGRITAEDIREKYAPGWNNLFVNEQKKYDVAKYVNRESVSYALDITEKANGKIGDNFFSKNMSDLSRLKESDITSAVGKYNFMGKTGIGMLIFIEGMDKSAESASGWITFVDMGSRKVLQTRRVTGDSGGFGFRNYWAKAFLNILKQADNS
jgi:hypothetical protein